MARRVAILAILATMAGCGSVTDTAGLSDCVKTAQDALDAGNRAADTADDAIDLGEQWKRAALRYERILDRHGVKYTRVKIRKVVPDP